MIAKQAQPKMSTKIRQGDLVIVTAGKDKGKQGAVKRVIKSVEKVKLIVEGVNIIKKHTRGDPNRNRPSQTVQKEAAIDVSNVQIYNQKTQKADRIGYRVEEDGQKVRYYKSTGDAIEASV